MSMTPGRWSAMSEYLGEVFGGLGEPIDMQLAGLMDRASGAGLPPIAVSADVGRMLMVLASVCASGGARGPRALEVGTLGGYSALWIARGLGESGSVVTVEAEPRHAAFARSEFARAKMEGRIEVREGPGLGVLPAIAEEFGPGSFDIVFLDAVKSEYRGYAEHASGLLRPGGLLVADNCLGSGEWWITDEPGASEARDAIDAFNRWIGGEGSGFLSCCVANREGLVVARKL